MLNSMCGTSVAKTKSDHYGGTTTQVRERERMRKSDKVNFNYFFSIRRYTRTDLCGGLCGPRSDRRGATRAA